MQGCCLEVGKYLIAEESYRAKDVNRGKSSSDIEREDNQPFVVGMNFCPVAWYSKWTYNREPSALFSEIVLITISAQVNK